MEIILNLASLAVYFLLKALVISAGVFLGSMVLARKPMHFWTVVRLTCVILLIVNLVLAPFFDGWVE